MWQVTRILMSINPAISREGITKCLFHDIGEISSGDAPYPVKADNPVLKAEHDRIERAGHLALVIPWGVPAPRQASGLEEWCIKLAEMLETWEFSLQEMMMGNRLARLIHDRNHEWLMWCLDEATRDPHAEIAQRAVSYMQRRTSTWRMTS